ncbi:MAG TPA: Na+/H+ antiporter subunit E [Gaiellaceae bacterium]
MRTAIRLALWWLVLWGVWLLYAGQHHTQEVVAGAIAAALSTGVAAALGRRRRYRLDRRELARAWALPWHVVRDFGVISLALLRGRPQGRWETVDFPAGSADRRALAGVLGSIAPNAYVVDFDRERGTALVHRLDPGHGRGDLP